MPFWRGSARACPIPARSPRSARSWAEHPASYRALIASVRESRSAHVDALARSTVAGAAAVRKVRAMGGRSSACAASHSSARAPGLGRHVQCAAGSPSSRSSASICCGEGRRVLAQSARAGPHGEELRKGLRLVQPVLGGKEHQCDVQGVGSSSGGDKARNSGANAKSADTSTASRRKYERRAAALKSLTPKLKRRSPKQGKSKLVRARQT